MFLNYLKDTNKLKSNGRCGNDRTGKLIVKLIWKKPGGNISSSHLAHFFVIRLPIRNTPDGEIFSSSVGAQEWPKGK